MKHPRTAAALCAALLAVLAAACKNPETVLDDYNTHFTPVATQQTGFVLTAETQGDMLEPVYRVSSEGTLCLTAPATGSYLWQLYDDEGEMQYSLSERSISIYMPTLDLYDRKKVTCELTLYVTQGGIRYQDTAIVLIYKQ